jgi:hypothetical protein
LQMTVVDALQSLAAPRPDLMGFVSLLRLHTHQFSEAMKRRDEAHRLGDSLDARGLSHDQDVLERTGTAHCHWWREPADGAPERWRHSGNRFA